ncbi:unnamed protein product [Closterium sp. Naga37s-1]|nr:unnamed protein product [Closterium sp. Naga37s-1]
MPPVSLRCAPAAAVVVVLCVLLSPSMPGLPAATPAMAQIIAASQCNVPLAPRRSFPPIPRASVPTDGRCIVPRVVVLNCFLSSRSSPFAGPSLAPPRVLLSPRGPPPRNPPLPPPPVFPPPSLTPTSPLFPPSCARASHCVLPRVPAAAVLAECVTAWGAESLPAWRAGSNCRAGAQWLQCDDAGMLTAIKLGWLGPGKKLAGSIPTALGLLTKLTFLRVSLWDLSYNQLVGSIPSTISNLANLRILSLSGNKLVGSIPPGIGALTALTELTLHNNELQGRVPPAITNLSSLATLNMRDNGLTGAIPSSIWTLAHLQDLCALSPSLPLPPSIASLFPPCSACSAQLEGNRLSGTLPASLGAMPALAEISLQENELSGSIPTVLAPLTALTHLSVTHHTNPRPSLFLSFPLLLLPSASPSLCFSFPLLLLPSASPSLCFSFPLLLLPSASPSLCFSFPLLLLPSASPSLCFSFPLLLLPSASPSLCFSFPLLLLPSASPSLCFSFPLLLLPSASPSLCFSFPLLLLPSASPALCFSFPLLLLPSASPSLCFSFPLLLLPSAHPSRRLSQKPFITGPLPIDITTLSALAHLYCLPLTLPPSDSLRPFIFLHLLPPTSPSTRLMTLPPPFPLLPVRPLLQAPLLCFSVAYTSSSCCSSALASNPSLLSVPTLSALAFSRQLKRGSPKISALLVLLRAPTRRLSNNLLSGSIPESITALASLVYVSVPTQPPPTASHTNPPPTPALASCKPHTSFCQPCRTSNSPSHVLIVVFLHPSLSPRPAFSPPPPPHLLPTSPSPSPHLPLTFPPTSSSQPLPHLPLPQHAGLQHSVGQHS